MEATQMMVDIDGDVLVFLELAQVSGGEGIHSPRLPPGSLLLPAGSVQSGWEVVGRRASVRLSPLTWRAHLTVQKLSP